VLVAGFAAAGRKAGNQHMKRQAAAGGGKSSIGTTKDGKAMLWKLFVTTLLFTTSMHVDNNSSTYIIIRCYLEE